MKASKKLSSGPQNLVFRLIEADSLLFGEAMEIYDISFPSNEKQDILVIKNRIRNGKCRLLGCLKDSQLVAFAILWDFPETRFSLLDYFAVKPEFRNGGIGRALLEKIRDEILATHRILLIEAENPKYGDHVKDKLRRISFYEKAGALWMSDTPYILPPLDGTNPTPMSILIIADFTIPSLTGSEVSSIFVRIFEDVYHLSDSDPVLISFLHLIPSIIFLEPFTYGKS